MSWPTGRNDQKPLPRADFLRQIPLLCPALPPCDLTLIGALLIRGIRRSSDNAATRPKLPITPTVLNEIRKQLTLTDSFDATFPPFYSFFRKASLLLLSRDKFDEHSHFRRSHLHLFSWGVVMIVRWNKTIQFKQRTLLIPVPRVNEFPLCPLTALASAYDLTRRRTLRSCLYVPPRDKTSDAYLPQISAKITSDFTRCGFKQRAICRSFV